MEQRVIYQIEEVVEYLCRMHPGFPQDLCVKASWEIEICLGLKSISGEFLTDLPNPVTNEKHHHHCWNRWDEETLIDVTGSQFNSLLEEELPSGLIIIKKEARLYSRYHPYWWHT